MILVCMSCVPGTQESNRDVTCADGEIFDPVPRKCTGGAITSPIPQGTTSRISILEDSGDNIITLAYSDNKGNFAKNCKITFLGNAEINNGSLIRPACSCVGGICRTTLHPAQDWNGQSGFNYTVTDADGVSPEKVVQVIVVPVNDNPVLIDSLIPIFLNEEATYIGSVANFVTDPELTEGLLVGFSFELVSNPVSGSILSFNSFDGGYTYTPKKDFSGSDSFTYKVLDDKGGISNIGTVLFTVGEVNDEPINTTSAATTLEDTPFTIQLEYNDIEGDFPKAGAQGCVITNLVNLNFTSCSCLLNICTLKLWPNSDYYTHISGIEDPGKSASFNYQVAMNVNSSVSSKVDVRIDQVNDPPFAKNVRVIGIESGSAVGTAFSFNLPSAIDLDDHDNNNFKDLTYKLVGDTDGDGNLVLTKGALSCSSEEGATPTFLNCTFTPNDGNSVGDSSVLGLLLEQGVRIEAKNLGSLSLVKLEILSDVFAGDEKIEIVGGDLIKIHIQSGVTSRELVKNLINSHSTIGNLISSSLEV